MKWNELKDGQKVVLQQDLFFIDEDAAVDVGYTYLTKAELDKVVSKSHATGTEYAYQEGPDEFLLSDDGDEMTISGTDVIDPAVWLVILD